MAGKNDRTMFAVFRRNAGDQTWYVSQVLYRSRENVDRSDEGAAKQCEERGDSAGAKYFRDKSNRRIVPIVVHAPAGMVVRG